MASGTLTITFDSMADLLGQLATLLGEHKCCGAHASVLVHPPVSTTIRGMSAPAEVGKRMEEPLPAAEAPKVENPPAVTGVASAEPAAINQETAPKQETPSVADTSVTLPTDNSVTLENVGTAEYEKLLAFCERNPGIGVEVSKCGPSYFRQLVEKRVTNYLKAQ